MDELNQIEKEKIMSFNDDIVLVNAIRKVLLASIYSNGTLRKEIKPDPLKNAALGLSMAAVNGQVIISNEQLGEDLRALTQAIALMENGFKELLKIKRQEKTDAVAPENPGK